MKIGFCGTMSVGKTTLVNALKELSEFIGRPSHISISLIENTGWLEEDKKTGLLKEIVK